MEVSGRKGAGSDDTSTGVLCDPCGRAKEDENAVFYCTVCNEYLCEACGKAHKRAKPSQSHHLLDKNSMPKHKLTSYEDNMCLKHKDEQVKHYCHMHDMCFCSVCASIEASHVGDLNIRHFTDTEDWRVKGGVMIGKNKLALLGDAGVKVVDVNTNTVISCIKLSGDLRDITCVNKDQIVVTCTTGKLVFLKVGKTLSIMKELDIGGESRGIAYTNNTLIVTFVYPDSCVKVINNNGRVLKTIKSLKTDKASGQLVSDPQYIYIALSTDQQTIYVSDDDDKSVTSFSLDGRVQHVYTSDNLRSPGGLAVDSNDNVYIVGASSYNIHQLSREGQFRQILLDRTHGLDRPSMVVYCKTGHKLYISNKDGKLVSVFQLD